MTPWLQIGLFQIGITIAMQPIMLWVMGKKHKHSWGKWEDFSCTWQKRRCTECGRAQDVSSRGVSWGFWR